MRTNYLVLSRAWAIASAALYLGLGAYYLHDGLAAGFSGAGLHGHGGGSSGVLHILIGLFALFTGLVYTRACRHWLEERRGNLRLFAAALAIILACGVGFMPHGVPFWPTLSGAALVVSSSVTLILLAMYEVEKLAVIKRRLG